MARRLRTPYEKATEALGIAQRQVDRLSQKKDRLVRQLSEIGDELIGAEERRDYLRSDPALVAEEGSRPPVAPEEVTYTPRAE